MYINLVRFYSYIACNIYIIVSIRNVTHADTVHVPFCSTIAQEISVQSERIRPLLKEVWRRKRRLHTQSELLIGPVDPQLQDIGAHLHGTNAYTYTHNTH